MATTESRTGFRLPWSTDKAATRDASADPADEPGATVPAGDSDAEAAATPEMGATSEVDAAGDRAHEEGEPVTTLASDAAPHSGAADAPVAASPEPPVAAPDEAAPWARPATPAPTSPAKRPTKFLADLTKAMQAAAEQARTATLDQFRADGSSVIEQIHGRSADGATELRRRADDDVAAIKEWSKAEIARIREETEQRVGARREQLEGQLERHAALVEHEIEKVRGRITAFEAEMGRFFDDLLGEDDPAVFAARAASLPEPPSFEDLDDDALGALLNEPGVGVPGSGAAMPTPAAPEAVVEAPETEGVAETEGLAEAVVEAPDAEGTEAPEGASEETPFDREAAMAAIQAAAEAAASVEAAEAQADRAEAAADRAEAVVTTHDEGEPAAEAATTEGEAPAGETTEGESTESELDPRLAMLGLTPDFAAAEEAAAAEAAEAEEVPEIEGDALAARLSGLVPGDAPASAAATVTTQVVVTGLVSVASIASFKRHLGRLAGVAHVGVSSGPDGEFVFSVEHEPSAALRDLIPTLPGFGARVVGSADGIVHVSAQDPQD